MSDDYYVLNKNPGSEDVLHRNPREVCNTDDAVGRQRVDSETADALISLGEARRCAHCMGGGE